MTFLHPALFAAGAAAVAIPILIHLLLRQRRKPVRWGAMRFLLEAYRKQRSKLRLQQFILLLVRCAMVILLALAVGRPVLDATGLIGGSSGRTVYLLIDTGLASGTRDASGTTALEQHVREAEALLDSLGPSDRAALITLGGPARAVVSPPTGEIAQLRTIVRSLASVESATDLRGGLELAADAIAGEQDEPTPTTVLVLSSFSRGSADLSEPLPPALAGLAGVRVVGSSPRQTAPGNVAITGVRPLRDVVVLGEGLADQQAVEVQLARTGDAVLGEGATSVRLRASADGLSGAGRVAEATVRWRPGQTTATTTLQIDAGVSETGRQAVLVASIDRDALEADNTWWRPVWLRDTINVGVVGRRRFRGGATIESLAPADWLRLALRPIETSPVVVNELSAADLDAPVLAASDAVILTEPHRVDDASWQALRVFVDAGGLLIVTPPTDQTVHQWTDAFTRLMGLPAWRLAREASTPDDEQIEAGEGAPLVFSLIAFELTDLLGPVTAQQVLGFEEPPAGAVVLLQTGDGSPWAVAQRPVDENEQGRAEVSRGLVVYLASPPDPQWTTLPLKPAMVPVVQELVRQGVGAAAGESWVVAGARIAVPAAASSLERASDDRSEAAERIDIDDAGLSAQPVRTAGVWTAGDAAGRVRARIAVNPAPSGSDTAAQPADAVRAWLAGATGDDAAPDALVSMIDDDTSATDVLAVAPTGSPVSFPLLVGLLALAVVEMFLARWFSHAHRPVAVQPMAPTAPTAAGGAAA